MIVHFNYLLYRQGHILNKHKTLYLMFKIIFTSTYSCTIVIIIIKVKISSILLFETYFMQISSKDLCLFCLKLNFREIVP